MIVNDRFSVAPGIAMPFYPARPMLGVGLRSASQAVAQFCADVDSGAVVQPKLNGDRASVGVVGDTCIVQNRHGGWTKQTVRNLAKFIALGNGTCLDGEIIDGDFYPFEALALAGKSLLFTPTVERVVVARWVCLTTGVPFLFSTPSISFIRQLRVNLPRWEGYVRKANVAYPTSGSATTETALWRKHRW